MAIIKNGVGGVGVHRALSNLSGRELILDADGDTSHQHPESVLCHSG